MCDAHLVVWTCIVYALVTGFVLSYAGGYRNMYLCSVLYLALIIIMCLHLSSQCSMAYLKVGAALCGFMLFTCCGGAIDCLKLTI